MKKKRILSIVLLLVSWFSGMSAQNAKQTEIIRQINEAASALKTMQCDFVQTKYIRLLNDKMVSQGKMFYSRTNKLRWQYTSPYSYTFILNGSTVLLNKGNRRDVIDVNQSKVFKEIARIMMNSVVGKSLSDKKDFLVSIADSPTEWVASLTPKRREMKMMFSKIVLHFDKRSRMVSTVELMEKKGDRTVIRLKNVQKNKSIDANIFNVR